MSERAATALVAACAFAFAAPGQACRLPAFDPPTDADNVARADAVFVAHIVRVEEWHDAPARGKALATFHLVEGIKGVPVPAGTFVTAHSLCEDMVLPGFDYLVFARRDADGRMTALPTHAGTRLRIASSDTDAMHLNSIKHLASRMTP